MQTNLAECCQTAAVPRPVYEVFKTNITFDRIPQRSLGSAGGLRLRRDVVSVLTLRPFTEKRSPERKEQFSCQNAILASTAAAAT